MCRGGARCECHCTLSKIVNTLLVSLYVPKCISSDQVCMISLKEQLIEDRTLLRVDIYLQHCYPSCIAHIRNIDEGVDDKRLFCSPHHPLSFPILFVESLISYLQANKKCKLVFFCVSLRICYNRVNRDFLSQKKANIRSPFKKLSTLCFWCFIVGMEFRKTALKMFKH